MKHVAHADKKYKNMTAKQRLRIANKTYEAYRMYYLEHASMPDDKAANEIHRKLFQIVVSLAPKTLFEEFEAITKASSSFILSGKKKDKLRHEEENTVRIWRSVENVLLLLPELWTEDPRVPR